LGQRAAALCSAALGLALLLASWALLLADVFWWPTWPAALALLFGHVGLRTGRGRAMRPVPLPQRTPAKPAAKTATLATAAKPAATTLPPDRATLGRYRIDRPLGRGAIGAVRL